MPGRIRGPVAVVPLRTAATTTTAAPHATPAAATTTATDQPILFAVESATVATGADASAAGAEHQSGAQQSRGEQLRLVCVRLVELEQLVDIATADAGRRFAVGAE